MIIMGNYSRFNCGQGQRGYMASIFVVITGGDDEINDVVLIR